MSLKVRISTYDNALGLKIGELIKISARSMVDYDRNNNRIVMRTEFKSPKTTYVVGSVKKALGKYINGSIAYGDHENYEQAHLDVSKYLWFYQCRDQMSEKPFLVDPNDITCI